MSRRPPSYSENGVLWGYLAPRFALSMPRDHTDGPVKRSLYRAGLATRRSQRPNHRYRIMLHFDNNPE